MPVLASLGLFWRLCVGAGLCAAAPFPPRLWGLGVVPRHPLCVPSPLFLFAASLGVLFPWYLARAYPGCGGCAVWLGGGGGVFDAGSGPFPWCFPLGGPMLALRVRV